MAWTFRRSWFLFVFLLVIILCFFAKWNSNGDQLTMLEFGDPEYLVYSNKCRIPNYLAWNSEFKKFYEAKSYVKCSENEPLSYIKYLGDDAILCMNKTAVKFYTKNTVNCCYRKISRSTGDEADIMIKYSPCKNFKNKINVSASEVVVECRDVENRMKVYTNAHSVIYKSKVIKKKMVAFKNKEKPPSVLLIGIDSISRLNFKRQLPRTKQILDNFDWIEYNGYNKVADNTFPNLMALLTGKNESTAYKLCNPRNISALDKCNFLWKNYSSHNYVTTYVEDCMHITTFNYLKRGFLSPPTDLYYKPYMMAAEDLGLKLVDEMRYCSGPESSGERILKIAREFVEQIGESPKFGLFWMNSFSHDNVNTPARMDEVFVHFFETLQQYLNNTIVLFFSDHGMRFGDVRLSKTGWYEERLPFIYFWIPKAFCDKYREECSNFVENRVKLTTPYDVYVTFQHVLALYGLTDTHSRSDACPNCKSLFENIEDRSCDEAAIPRHWCTCFGYKPLHTRSELVTNAGEFALSELNKNIKKYENTSRHCVDFKLETIIISQATVLKNATLILFMFKTVPKAIFEFTVSFDSSRGRKKFKMEGGISRLDSYEPASQCVHEQKMYCFCRWNLEMKMNFFSFWFEV